MTDQPPRLTDEQLRLECARLVAVFSNGQGNQVEQTDALYRFIRDGESK